MLRGRWMAWKATSWSRVSIPRWSWGTSGWSWCVPMFSIRSEFFPQLSHRFILFHIVSPCYTAWLELSEGLKERARSGRFGWPREMESQQVTIDMGGEKTVRVNAGLVQSGWGQQICRDAIWPLARKRRFEGWLQYVRRLFAQSVHAADWLSCSHSSYCFFPLGFRSLWQFCTFEC